MHLARLLQRAVELYPQELAVVDGHLRLAWREVGSRTATLAADLAARGVAHGARVAILDLNSAAYLESYFACAALGAIACPLNHRLSLRELTSILTDAEARVLIHGAEHARLAMELRTALSELDCVDASAPRDSDAELRIVPVAPTDVAQLYYTSGTTGVPKGVMLTHQNVWVHALAAIAELELSDRDRWAHIAPMFHLADAWATFAITWSGGAHVMVPRFDEEAVFAAIERERVTITNLVPTMLTRLVRHPGADGRDVASLRRILSGGAPIAPEVVREIMRVFRCEYVQTYGMTETSPYLTLSLLKEHLRALPPERQFAFRAKTGRAFAAVELAVIGDDGTHVARDGASVGEIRARGPTVTPGYWRRPDETARAFADGWLCTGDLATIDSEGYLQIVDRAKDVIITGGEKVYSTEVESVLYEHSAVLEAAVFGIHDELWGERVHAAVTLRNGASAREAELIEFCRARLTHYKAPRAIEFVAELPKTGTGKIAKRALRDRHAPR